MLHVEHANLKIKKFLSKKFISNNYYIFKLTLKHDTIDSIEMR